MDTVSFEKITTETSSNTYVLWRPTGGKTDDIFYTKEAQQILALSAPSAKKKLHSTFDLRPVCLKWKNIFDQEMKNINSEEHKKSEIYLIDIIKSGRRRYMVKGLALSGAQGSSQQQDIFYMFLLERIHPDSINLPLLLRESKLNQREQDIVRLLLEDRSNKEIAYALGLSLNTVKAYMKLLMRKLGVNTRAGVISYLLTKRNPAASSS
jgi:DNA-binding CsgD family transcriptional regulator